MDNIAHSFINPQTKQLGLYMGATLQLDIFRIQAFSFVNTYIGTYSLVLIDIFIHTCYS